MSPMSGGGRNKSGANDDLLLSSDTEVMGVQGTYTKIKEIKVNFAGIYRIKFDLHRQTTGTAYGQIWKNGVAYGTERSTASETYVTFTEDLFFNEGDLIQLYAKTVGGQWNAQNFRIYSDLLLGVVNL